MKKLLVFFVFCAVLVGQNPNTAVFPTAIATDQDLLVATDRATATLASSISNSDTQIPLNDATRFVPPVAITIGSERIKICSRSVNTLTTCTNGRGAFGSSASSHNSGDAVNGFIIANHVNQLSAEQKSVENFLGVNGANVEQTARKGVANGYAGLNGSGVVPESQLLETAKLEDLVDVPAGAGQLYYLRRKANVSGTSYEFAVPQVFSVSDYNFPQQSPTGTLSAGVSHTSTLTPCPLGVNGADSSHYILLGGGTVVISSSIIGATNATPIVIQTSSSHGFSTGNFITITGVTGNTASNGTFTVTFVDATHFSLDGSKGNGTYGSGGTATRDIEPALITGGTCTSGSSTGTITFTPANPHDGNWYVASASAGIQEAIIASGTYGQVYLPGGDYDTYATITSSLGASIFGASVRGSRILTHRPVGDVLYMSVSGATTSVVDVHDLSFDSAALNRTSGAMLHVFGRNAVRLRSLFFDNVYDGIDWDKSNGFISNCEWASVSRYGIHVHGGTISPYAVSSGTFTSVKMSNVDNTNGEGIKIEDNHEFIQITGGQIGPDAGNTGGGKYGIHATGGRAIAVASFVITQYGDTAIKLGSPAAGEAHILLQNIVTDSVAAGNTVLDIDHSVEDVTVSGLSSIVRGTYGIRIRGSFEVTLSSLSIACDNTSTQKAISIEGDAGASNAPANGVTITGNRIGYGDLMNTTNACAYGIWTDSFAHTRITVTGNDIFGLTNGLLYQATGAQGFFQSNHVVGGSKPTCASYVRSSTWNTESIAGVKDAYEVCAKDAADVYAWRAIY